MYRYPAGAIVALVLACSSHAQAIDFHPLVSQDLTGGVYEFDNILIPEGVTLTLVGEPGQAILRAQGTLTLAGSLIAPGWEVRLEAGDSIQIRGTIDMAGGTLSVTPLSGDPGLETPGDVHGRDIQPPAPPVSATRFQGALIRLASGGELALVNTQFSEGGNLSLVASGPLALQGIVPASVFQGGRLAILGWERFDMSERGAVSFAASLAVTNHLLNQQPLPAGYLRIASEGVLLREDGAIEISGIQVFGPEGVQSFPESLVVQASLPVPEAETWAMLLAGLGLLGMRRWLNLA